MSRHDTCVIGWPIGHSRSPLIHNYWLETHSLPGRYAARAVQPAELARFFESFHDSGLLGCNVTVPHKEATARLLAIEDDLTARLHAVNTVFLRKQSLVGTNTDGYGFITNLEHAVPDLALSGASVLVLGAGGSARAVVGALLAAGVERIDVTNRTRSRAHEISRLFGDRLFDLDWNDREAALSRCDLLVNTTVLGMTGQPALDLSLDGLPRHAVVADLVYSPLETGLLARARARDHRTADGLGMLLYQAQAAFRHWHGITPQVTAELRDLVTRDLLGKRASQ
ncbi:MAG TPA: shikimate dehydrogenase [Aestuariivirgaceae bacterium]|nr:shikimate dehydrogenase [Aestuariivirgaceae bacterium]